MTNNLDKIEHIVFLMRENRSFDNMLGANRLHLGMQTPPIDKPCLLNY
jgi:phospholipase C